VASAPPAATQALGIAQVPGASSFGGLPPRGLLGVDWSARSGDDEREATLQHPLLAQTS
jgi:hypothetical protein